ncbi:hypothetical protein BMS3Abin08_01041 [bacterium BMS3Abin08]|nr:hypothetical protein BMS3Abin08_01041 [bacterium BMS3Abin08]
MVFKKQIAKEMVRVLTPDGIIPWYDYHMNNLKNPKRITLAPPITRMVAPSSWIACYLLQKLKIFNTHYLCIIRKLAS